MLLLESFSLCELPCEFQADPYFTWHLETPSEDQAKPPHGTQAAMKDKKRPSCLGVTVQHHKPPLITTLTLAKLLSQSRHGVGLVREGGWCSPNRAVGSAPATESPSVLTELGTPAGNRMDTDINQPDAN